jgi:hypothetical protein
MPLELLRSSYCVFSKRSIASAFVPNILVRQRLGLTALPKLHLHLSLSPFFGHRGAFVISVTVLKLVKLLLVTTALMHNASRHYCAPMSG